jgi:hypothetical protein
MSELLTILVLITAYAIARILWFAYPGQFSDLSFLFMNTPVGVRLVLLAALVGVLLFSNARRVCAAGKT